MVDMENWKKLNSQRVDFYPEDFDRAILQHGMRCLWEEAIQCECIDGSGQPSIGCKYCSGRGYRYLPPKAIRVLVSSFSNSSKLELPGLRESGIAYATPTMDHIMGLWDRLSFIDFRRKFTEVLHLGAGKDTTESSYREIIKLVYLLRGNSVLEEGLDFEITSDSHHLNLINPEFITNSDTNYSVLYYTTPRYIVREAIHELRATAITRKVEKETYVELPKQYLIQREEME